MINSIIIASLINFGTLYVELHNTNNDIILNGFSTTNIENLSWVENIENDEITSVKLLANYYDNIFNFVYDNNGVYENGELYDDTYGPITIELNNSEFLEDLNSYRQVDLQKNIYTNSYSYIENISIYLNTNNFDYDVSNNYFYLVCDFEVVIRTLNNSYSFTGLENLIVSYSTSDITIQNIFQNYSSKNSIFSAYVGEIFLDNNIFEEKFDAYTTGYNQGYTSGSNASYNNGYEDGYEDGYTTGEQIGYEDGYATGENKKYDFIKIIKGGFDAASNFFNIEIFPGVKFIYIIGIPIVIAVLRFVIGWFR